MAAFAVFLYVLLIIALALAFAPLLHRDFEANKKSITTMVVFLVAGCLLLHLLGSLFANPWFYKTYWVVRPFAALLISVLLSKTFRVMFGATALFRAIWGYLIYEFSYDLHQVIRNFLLPNTKPGGMMYSILMVICYGCLYTVVYFGVLRRLPTDGNWPNAKRQTVLMLQLALIATLFKPLGPFLSNGSLSYNIFVLVQLVFAFLVMCMIYIQYETGQRDALEAELMLQRRLWQEHEKQFQQSIQNQEIMNCKYHDLKHYIAAARSAGSNPAWNQALDEIEAAVKVFERTIQTGNEILDTVLREKALACEQDNIVMSCFADGCLIGKIEAVDLYAMFGNAIDNAVTCVRALEDVEQRVISVAIFRVKNMVKIQIENPYNVDLEFQDGLPISTKENREYHGYGLKSIRSISEKYGGYLSVEATDHVFTLHILFPATEVSMEVNASYEEKTTS